MAGGYLPRTFACVCGRDHALLDDNDVWWQHDADGRPTRIVGRTACLLAAGLITQEQADA